MQMKFHRCSAAESPCPQTALDIYSISTGCGHLWTAPGFVFVREAERHSAAMANHGFTPSTCCGSMAGMPFVAGIFCVETDIEMPEFTFSQGVCHEPRRHAERRFDSR